MVGMYKVLGLHRAHNYQVPTSFPWSSGEILPSKPSVGYIWRYNPTTWEGSTQCINYKKGAPVEVSHRRSEKSDSIKMWFSKNRQIY